MNRLRSSLQLRPAGRFMGILLAASSFTATDATAQWSDLYACDAGMDSCTAWDSTISHLIYAPTDSRCWCYLSYQQRECGGVTEFRVLAIGPVNYEDMECESFRDAVNTGGNPLRIVAQKRMFQEAMDAITRAIAERKWRAANRWPGDPAAVAAMRCPNGYVAVRGVSSYCMSTSVEVVQPQSAWYRITDSMVYVDEEGRVQRFYYYSDASIPNGHPVFTSGLSIGAVDSHHPLDQSGMHLTNDGSRLVGVPHIRVVYTPCGGAVCCRRETRICYEGPQQQRVIRTFRIAPTNPPETCRDGGSPGCTPWCDETTSINGLSMSGE